jgi:hypothetical protein
VEDADKAVAEGSECLVVQVPGSAALIVEGAGAGAGVQGAEGPLVDRVVEPAIADVAGQHGAFLARRDRQR